MQLSYYALIDLSFQYDLIKSNNFFFAIISQYFCKIQSWIDVPALHLQIIKVMQMVCWHNLSGLCLQINLNIFWIPEKCSLVLQISQKDVPLLHLQNFVQIAMYDTDLKKTIIKEFCHKIFKTLAINVFIWSWFELLCCSNSDKVCQHCIYKYQLQCKWYDDTLSTEYDLVQ